MKQIDESWALFWCDLLHPVLFGEVEADQTQEFLKDLSNRDVVFPGGRLGRPSLSTLRRKLNRYQKGGFDSLARKERKDRGQTRATSTEIIEKAIELKKEQPRRSHGTINRFLKDIHVLNSRPLHPLPPSQGGGRHPFEARRRHQEGEEALD